MSGDSKGQGRGKFPEAPDEILCRWCAESLHLTCKPISHGQPLAGQVRHGLGTLHFHIETSSPVFGVTYQATEVSRKRIPKENKRDIQRKPKNN